MEIKYRNIVLRDMRESDIDDEIRWNTVETQWALWDAPWEIQEELLRFDQAAFRQQELAFLEKPKPEPRTTLELDTADGVHIGAVSSYLIDSQCNWVPRDAVKPGQEVFRTLGLDISESVYWSRGLGTQALTAWILYYLERGTTELRLQTWSGNVRMVKAARRLGFEECCRNVGSRSVRGELYDGLTFRLNLSAFHRYLQEENRKEQAHSPEPPATCSNDG